MVGSRTLTAAGGLAVSLLVSVLAWVYLDTLLLFLVLPFVPVLFRGWGGADQEPERERPRRRECPVCDYRTRDPTHDYCPRDGHRLE